MFIEEKYRIIDENLINDIINLCREYQDERVSGHWFIRESGLKKIAKLIKLDLTVLSRASKKKFHFDCINTAQCGFEVKNNLYYYGQ